MTRDDLARLAEKYAALGDLRRARERGEPPPAPHVFQALAGAFPGCLRELDTLPLDAIDARRAALSRAADGAAIEPWMEWVAGYHEGVRARLAAPGPRGRINDRVFAALAERHGVPAETIARAVFARVRG